MPLSDVELMWNDLKSYQWVMSPKRYRNMSKQQPPPPKTPPPSYTPHSGGLMPQSSTTGIVVQYSRPKVGGIEYGHPWTGGHRDPLKIEPEPMSPYCWRTQEMEQNTFKRVKEGVKDCCKLKKKEDLWNVKSEF